MQLLATQYTLSNQSLDIYFAGCKGEHCKGCHNPESWHALGETVTPRQLANQIIKKANENTTLIKNLMLLGGEPLDQDHTEMYDFLRYLQDLDKVDIWLFTKYEIYDVPFNLRIKCDYIKTGRYIEELATKDNVSYGITLATSNQKVLKRGLDY